MIYYIILSINVFDYLLFLFNIKSDVLIKLDIIFKLYTLLRILIILYIKLFNIYLNWYKERLRKNKAAYKIQQYYKKYILIYNLKAIIPLITEIYYTPNYKGYNLCKQRFEKLN